jgi:ribosomal-protein-alanine N-acetyltransferase
MRDLAAEPRIPLLVRYMEIEDIPEVMVIEKDSFPLPWSAAAYRYELNQNDLSHYVVVRWRELTREAARASWLDRWLKRTKPDWPSLVGYGGFWTLGDEAHVSTIAVRPDWRGHGFGELLLAAMIDLALSLNVQIVTLEVRVSNFVAQNLYRKYLFKEVGRRRRYYHDNGEDALIMTTPRIDRPTFQKTYRQHRQALYERLRCLKAPAQPKQSPENVA